MPPSTPPTSPPSRGHEPDLDPGRDSAGRVKRPRYLLVALILALLFGAGCWTEGCGRLSFYHSDANQGELLNAAIKDKEDRAHADALYKKFVEVADARSSRVVPLAAATFVLGAALLALAVRALSGRANTRSALVQVVIAQAIVVAAGWFLIRDVHRAELDWEVERTLLVQRESMTPEEYAEVAPVLVAVTRVVGPGWLVLRTIASGLIVLALTRPRSRAFFDRAGEPARER